jgi:hypothetical protein
VVSDIAGKVVEDSLDFLLTYFDVLGSETGKPGTWKVLYEARELRNGPNVAYEYWESDTSTGIPVYVYDEKFSDEMTVSHIALGIHGLNVETNVYGEHINIHEFQVFSSERYAVSEPSVITGNETMSDSITVEDLIPRTPAGMVAVAAVLSTGCSAGCMAWIRKKENA